MQVRAPTPTTFTWSSSAEASWDFREVLFKPRELLKTPVISDKISGIMAAILPVERLSAYEEKR